MTQTKSTTSIHESSTSISFAFTPPDNDDSSSFYTPNSSRPASLHSSPIPSPSTSPKTCTLFSSLQSLRKSQSKLGDNINNSDLTWEAFIYMYARGMFDPLSIPKKPGMMDDGKPLGKRNSCPEVLDLSEENGVAIMYKTKDCKLEKRKTTEFRSVKEMPKDSCVTESKRRDHEKEYDIGKIWEKIMSESRNTTTEANEDTDNEEMEYLEPPMPPNEDERRRALWRFQILNTPPDENFNRIVSLAKNHFKVQNASICLVNTDHQWYKAGHESGFWQTSRAASFSGHAILQKDGEPLVVQDATLDWRFKRNPLVLGPPYIRFYAGAALRTKDGYNIGTLCLTDDTPRHDFDEEALRTLKEFSKIVVRELELWSDKIRLGARNKMLQSIAEFSKFSLVHIKAQLASSDKHKAPWSPSPEAFTPFDDPIIQKCFDLAVKLMRETLDVDAVYLLEMPSLYHFVTTRMGSEFALEWNGSVEAGEKQKPYLRFLASTGLELSPHTLTTEATTEFLLHVVHTHEQGYIFQNALPPIPALFPSHMQSGIVVPVYGSSNRAFGFIIALTKDRLRQFDDEERVYLGDFGVNIASEVLKRRVIVADRAKSAFVSSISHELRTPLHCILGSCELLDDSQLSDTQKELLCTIQGCGVNLISIVNSVLEYVKLDGDHDLAIGMPANDPMPSPPEDFSPDRPPSSYIIRNTGHAPIMPVPPVIINSPSKLRSVNLIRLLEDVAEACVVGQQMLSVIYNKPTSESNLTTHARRKSLMALLNSNREGRCEDDNVELFLDVEKRERGWNVLADDGNIRLILVNIIGNALKFTSKGYVHLSLTSVPVQTSPDQGVSLSNRIKVLFTITDTGHGISPQFLTTELFQPFSQEDSLRVGTGLGLSIVRSLVEKLNGKLDVKSTLGVGTSVKIWLEFEETKQKVDDEAEKTLREQFYDDMKNQTVLFKGFPDKFQEVFERYFTTWLNVKKIVTDNSSFFNKPDPHIILINNDLDVLTKLMSSFANTYSRRSSFSRPRERSSSRPMVIFITTLAKHAQVSRAIKDTQLQVESLEKLQDGFEENSTRKWIVVVVPTPIGPNKIEQAVLNCLRMAKSEERVASHENTTQFSPGSSDPVSDDMSTTSPRVSLLSKPRAVTNNPSESSSEFRFDVPTQLALHHSNTCLPKVLPPTVHSSSQKRAPFNFTGTVSASQGPKVLIVEDNAVNRMIIAKFLKKIGVEYEEAENGAVGVERFRKRMEEETVLSSNGKIVKKGFDIIFMDIQMPVMNGNIATSEIRRIEKEITDRRNKRVKRILGFPIPIMFSQFPRSRSYPYESRSLIFALTGLASDEDKLLAFESGVDDFLTKPVSLKLLEKALKKWTERKEKENKEEKARMAEEEDMKKKREKDRKKRDYRIVCVIG
ncbi:4489_t:CDS:2 [Paraglomus brasilianum]|uniref:4489_t:CDS:1 n=1 Tax=Paraglomus brasilianum TaxID=144538 RepID=A0A9N9GJI1_9GLOM|nr:4489_t:CDS:2 [Paraglomus brasilianum]